MALAERILDMVAAVPAGRVTTYGDIAARAGTRSPRLVGRVLRDLADSDTPWFRVIRADGTIAPQLADRQSAELRAEGVVVAAGKVDLARYRWR